MLCGKAVAKADSTYLTQVKLREKFIQLKNFLTINEKPKVEAQNIETLKGAVSRLQEELTTQKVITETISEDNAKLKQKIDEVTEKMNAFYERAAWLSTMAAGDKSGFYKIPEEQTEKKKSES